MINHNERIAKGISKILVDFAVKHKISLRRDWNNDYMILENGNLMDMSFQPTVKSALCMMKRYLRNKTQLQGAN